MGAVPSDSTVGKPGYHRYHEAAGPGRCETQVFQGLSKTQVETEPVVVRLPDASSRGTLERTALSGRFARPAGPEKSQQKKPGSTSAPGEVCALPLSSARSQTAPSGHTVKDPLTALTHPVRSRHVRSDRGSQTFCGTRERVLTTARVKTGRRLESQGTRSPSSAKLQAPQHISGAQRTAPEPKPLFVIMAQTLHPSPTSHIPF